MNPDRGKHVRLAVFLGVAAAVGAVVLGTIKSTRSRSAVETDEAAPAVPIPEIVAPPQPQPPTRGRSRAVMKVAVVVAVAIPVVAAAAYNAVELITHMTRWPFQAALGVPSVLATAIIFGGSVITWRGFRHRDELVVAVGSTLAGGMLISFLLYGVQAAQSRNDNNAQLSQGIQQQIASVADLSGANFEGFNVSGMLLVNRKLSKASFAGIDADNVQFSGSKLDGAMLLGTQLRGASVDGADLTAATLTMSAGSYLQATSASMRDLRAQLANLSFANFNYARMERADLTAALLRGSSMENVVLRNARLVGADLTGVSLRSSDLRGADLSGARLPRLANGDYDYGSFTGVTVDRHTILPDDFRFPEIPGGKADSPPGGVPKKAPRIVSPELAGALAGAPHRNSIGRLLTDEVNISLPVSKQYLKIAVFENGTVVSSNRMASPVEKSSSETQRGNVRIAPYSIVAIRLPGGRFAAAFSGLPAAEFYQVRSVIREPGGEEPSDQWPVPTGDGRGELTETLPASPQNVPLIAVQGCDYHRKFLHPRVQALFGTRCYGWSQFAAIPAAAA